MKVKLILMRSEGPARKILLKDGANIIGRRPDCDIQIASMWVSRQHCQIHCTDDQAVLEDLGSSNGTFINRKRVMREALSAGDVVSVGQCNFVLTIDGQPDAIGADYLDRLPAESSS